MGAPTSLFRGLTGMARDWPRDRMPDGYVWDLADYVPVLLDAQLTGRGGWKWYSAAAGGPIQGGIHAPFRSGDRLLVIANGRLLQVNQSTGALTDLAAAPAVRQNPVMLNDTVAIPADGDVATKIATATASAVTLADVHATAPKGPYATVYKSRLVLGGSVANPHQLAASKLPTKGGPTAAWDVETVFNSSLALTGIGALRAMILLFHAGSVERIRGSSFPEPGTTGDMFIDNLFDRAGCGDARSIAYWNDNCIFADERGVHLTDGAVVRNLISQGGMITYWRALFRNRSSIAACTYLDYYITTVVRTDGLAVTLVCDLQRRSWFRFTNIKAISYIQSVGEQERIWTGMEPEHRLASLADCFFPPAPTVDVEDANGVDVLPVVETPWYRLVNQEGRKRSRFVYTSYDVRVPPDAGVMAWRRDLLDADAVNDAVVAALPQMLEVGYITSPQELSYTVAGRLPSTQKYRRYRLPIGMHPYGIAFRIRQVTPSAVTRVFDFAVEAQPEERSRV